MGASVHREVEGGVFQGKTALMWASSQGRDDVTRILLTAGAEVDYSSKSGNFKGDRSHSHLDLSDVTNIFTFDMLCYAMLSYDIDLAVRETGADVGLQPGTTRSKHMASGIQTCVFANDINIHTDSGSAAGGRRRCECG